MMDTWTVEPTEAAKNTLSLLCEKLMLVRKEKELASDVVKDLASKESDIEQKIITHMKENSLHQIKGAFGTVSLVFTKSIRVPESQDEKLKLFDYLREQGIFEQMVSVNSRTLNSWAKKEIEAKEEEGLLGWVPPGLKPPTEFADIRITKK